MHCYHPDRLKVSETAWDTLEMWFCTCDKWEGKKCKKCEINEITVTDRNTSETGATATRLSEK